MPSVTVYSDNQYQSVCNRLNGSTLIAGSNQEDHMPIGWGASSSRWRALVKFSNISASIPAGARIVSAVARFKTTGSNVHLQKGSNTRLRISRITQNWTAGGGSGEGWYTNAATVGFGTSSSSAITYAAEGQHKHGTVYDYDITDYVENWLSGAYYKRNGQPCDNMSNYGIEIKADDEDSNTRATEFWSNRGGYNPRLIITYTLEADPTAATIVAPVAGDQASAPDVISFTTPAGDTAIRYAIRVGTTLDGTDIVNTGWVNFTPGGQTDVDVSAAPWVAGQTLYLYVRTENSVGVSAYRRWQIYVLPVPSVSIAHPPSGGRCHVHNLNELKQWTGSGAEAKPRVEVTYTHPTGVAAQVIEVSVDNGATWHTFPGVGSGETAVCDVPQAVARNADFIIKARATGGGGQSAPEVSLTARVNWSQVVLNFAPSAGSSDYVSAHAPVAGGARTQARYAYAVSPYTSWVASPGELPAGTTAARMLVRLSTSDTAQQPSVADMTIRYQKTPPPAPDFWEAWNASISLDAEFRRFGVHSLKVVPVGGQPHRVRNTRRLIVSPDTEYTVSVYVNTLGKDVGGSIRLALELGPSAAYTELTGDERQTWDSTGKGKENWQRLWATFKTPVDVTEIKPLVVGASTITSQYRIDSMQLESGSVASSWRPGTLGPAVILDVGGVAIDGQAGGIFRARGSNGPVVTLGADGLLLDGVPYITAADVPAPAAPVRRVYTANATWTKPAGLLYAEVEVQGGGGGGGGCNSTGTSEAAAGSGGGAGGYVKKLLAASALGATATVVVGAAGQGVTNANGTAGTGSSFASGAVSLEGGGGGNGLLGTTGAGATITDGGAGGTASGGDVNVVGQKGGMGGRFSFSGVTSARPITSNDGGDSMLGIGGLSDGNGPGAAGTGFGAGGGGAVNNVSQSPRVGGNGAPGVVIVTEYYS